MPGQAAGILERIGWKYLQFCRQSWSRDSKWKCEFGLVLAGMHERPNIKKSCDRVVTL